ncbi:MAG: rhamnulokinase [Ruminococcaceae bacterium]|nr:rhamnulokinase [Oscillospiraceae bacterium]
MKYYLAIDIGASSGRHIVGYEENGKIATDEVYRFPNGMETVNGHLVWNIEKLFESVLSGIAAAFKKYPEIESLSIDTWGVDYVLMSDNDEIMPVYAYRDSRTEAVIDEVHSLIPFKTLYEHTGIQFQRFNTLYQLYVDKLSGRLDTATDFLMIPEYLMYKLTGNKVKEFTNATTTGMINAYTLRFDRKIWSSLGLPISLDSNLAAPGTSVGRLKPDIAKRVGGDTEVVLCATHDTASAVEAIDMEANAPYISSGTWSLLGVKTPTALTDDWSCESNYSNEGGVGYNRYQKNITGMWIVQCLRKELCPEISYDDIVKLAEDSSFLEIFDVNDDAFVAPKSMRAAIDTYMKENNKDLPRTLGDYFKCAYISLANCYGVAISEMEHNTGTVYSDIYVVGGGAKNEYLNKMTERYTGKRVIALPIEATAIGNLKIQMKR